MSWKFGIHWNTGSLSPIKKTEGGTYGSSGRAARVQTPLYLNSLPRAFFDYECLKVPDIAPNLRSYPLLSFLCGRKHIGLNWCMVHNGIYRFQIRASYQGPTV